MLRMPAPTKHLLTSGVLKLTVTFSSPSRAVSSSGLELGAPTVMTAEPGDRV